MNLTQRIEEIKPVIGYENLYKISSLGYVKNNEGKILKLSFNGKYMGIGLVKDKKQKTFLFHRLLAIHFIANPENKPQVNHKDGNKLNNDLDNLEWATISENAIHSVHVLKNPMLIVYNYGSKHFRARPIIRIDKDGNTKEYSYMTEAVADGFTQARISECCNGKRAEHNGYKWQFQR